VFVVNRGADIEIRLPTKYDFIDNITYKRNKNCPSISDIIWSDIKERVGNAV